MRIELVLLLWIGMLLAQELVIAQGEEEPPTESLAKGIADTTQTIDKKKSILVVIAQKKS